jgi:hypothetical protein
VAQEAKLLARDHKNAPRFFSKPQSRSLVGAGQVLWLRIAGGPGYVQHQPGSSDWPSVARPPAPTGHSKNAVRELGFHCLG